MEQEFYEFVRDQFFAIRDMTFEDVKGNFHLRPQQFMFEKIRPR